MRKALSPPAIVFKGSGWAKVDARAGGGKKKGDGAGTEAPATATGGEGGRPSSESAGKRTGSGASADTKSGSD
jgi:hypothetical protein